MVRLSSRILRPELQPQLKTRTVSVAGIRLDSREFARPFKGIICADICEFESYMPSQAVPSLRGNSGSRELAAARLRPVGAASILCRRRDRRHLPNHGQLTLAHRVDRRWPQSKYEHRDEARAPAPLLAERQSDRQNGSPLLRVP